MPASASHAKNNMGNITLVGCAASVKAKEGTFVIQTISHKLILLPPSVTTDSNVTGNASPVCNIKVKASHINLFSCCFTVHW